MKPDSAGNAVINSAECRRGSENNRTMSNPRGCCLSQVQAPLHVILRPGLWLPGSRTPHLYIETWRIEGSPQNAFKDILNAIETVENRARLILRQADEEQLFIQVMSFTKLCNWVDVVEIQFDTALSQTGQLIIYIYIVNKNYWGRIIPLL